MAVDSGFGLRERLKSLGITQVGFATLLDVDATTVRAWVRMGTPGPARRIVEVLEYETGLAPMPDWLAPLVERASHTLLQDP